MPSTTTYLEAVNEVLFAAGVPEITDTAAAWSAVVGKPLQAKRIVARCLDEFVNQVPDLHWQHLKELTVRPIFTTGTITAVNGVTVTVSGVDLTTGFTDLGYVSKHCLFFMGGESDWLKVEAAATTTITLRQAHPTYTSANNFPTAQQTTDGDTTRTFKLWQWRFDLPANFRDVQDAYRPFQGYDVEPLDLNGFVRRAVAPAVFLEGHELLYYAIGSDQTVDGAPSTLAEAADSPLMYLFPALQNARTYQIAYQRQPFRIEPTSDLKDVLFDLPEDLMRQLIYRAKLLGSIELARDSEAAGLYRSMEKEQRKNAEAKETTKHDAPQIRGPGTMYGAHFRKQRIGRGIDVVTWD